MNPQSNAPESEALTLQDTVIFENARGAANLLKKTFETWVVIGKAVVRARDIANERGGGKTFMRLLDQQALGWINKTTASNLLRIMEQLPGVTKWHEELTDKEQIDWAAPTTILKRCPVFQTAKPDPADKPPTKAEQDRMALAATIEENHQLKQQLEASDGDRFKPTDRIEDIANALFGTFEGFKNKGKKIAQHWLNLYQT
jgi:hypothetical protein